MLGIYGGVTKVIFSDAPRVYSATRAFAGATKVYTWRHHNLLCWHQSLLWRQGVFPGVTRVNSGAASVFAGATRVCSLWR